MSSTASTQQFQVTAGETPQRLDRFLWIRLHGPSRSKIQRWIEAGLVLVNDAPHRAAQKVRPGDRITLAIPPPTPTRLRPEAIPLEIVYEDDHLLVVNKPAGLVAHPAPGHPDGTLVNALLHHCGPLQEIGGRERPGLVHRLDKETSGLLVVAKTEAAYQGLVAQFKHHTIERTYVAIVAGRPVPPRGEIALAIGRDRIHRKKFSGRTARPKPSVSRYRVTRLFDAAALVEVMPLTGRTHQIRVHLASIQHPVLGDKLYSNSASRELANHHGAPPINRHLLHAQSLGICHPITQQKMRWEAPVPDDMAAVLAWLGSVDKA